MDLYASAIAAGLDTDSHESDLYLPATDEAIRLVRESGRSASYFISQIDRRMWIDIPFAYTPWWERRLPSAPRAESETR